MRRWRQGCVITEGALRAPSMWTCVIRACELQTCGQVVAASEAGRALHCGDARSSMLMALLPQHSSTPPQHTAPEHCCILSCILGAAVMQRGFDIASPVISAASMLMCARARRAGALTHSSAALHCQGMGHAHRLRRPLYKKQHMRLP
jgi:hypothetical protein